MSDLFDCPKCKKTSCLEDVIYPGKIICSCGYEEDYKEEIIVSELERNTLLFQELGLTRLEGKILYTLLSGKPLSAKEIERSADLRQPEISTGTKKLLSRGWIREKNQNGMGKGRPQKIYVLLAKPEQIYNDLCRGYSETAKIQEENLMELKRLMLVK